MKNAIGILVGGALNLEIALGNRDILILLILPIHEHAVSFHLFVSSSISFISVLSFSVYKSFTSLVKFTSLLVHILLFLMLLKIILFS